MNNNFSIQSILNAYFEQEINKEKKEKDKSFYASQLGTCLRKQIWKRQGKKPSNLLDGRRLRIFSVGDIFHEWIQSKLKKTGILIKVEGEIVNTKYNYRGRYDALVEKNGKKLVYDFKTVHSRAYHYKDFPYKHHQIQLASYVLFLQKDYPDLDEGRLLYISKDDLCLKEIPLKLTQEWKKKVLKELKVLNKYYKIGKIPSKLPLEENGDLSWQCKWCQYKDICQKEREKEK